MIITFIVNALAFWIVAQLVPGWKIKDFPTSCVVSLIYGFISFLLVFFKVAALIFPIPLMMVFGPHLVKFSVHFLCNLLVVTVTDKLVDDFHIENLATSVVGCTVLVIVQTILGILL